MCRAITQARAFPICRAGTRRKGRVHCCMWGMRRSTVVFEAEQGLTSSVFLLCSSLRSFFLPVPSCYPSHPRRLSKHPHTTNTSAFFASSAIRPQIPHALVDPTTRAHILPVLPSDLLPIRLFSRLPSQALCTLDLPLGLISYYTRIVIPQVGREQTADPRPHSNPFQSS